MPEELLIFLVKFRENILPKNRAANKHRQKF
jgi:hypothetical protein